MSAVLTRLREALAQRLPPALRRAGAGLLLDLQSLPERLRDPARRGDPWQTWHNVGAGDFHAVGDNLLDTLVTHAGLEPDDRVLDIGCGSGRVARPLAAYLSPTGGYLGFAVSRRAILGCRRRLAATPPAFDFVHPAVRNAAHNARGTRDETPV